MCVCVTFGESFSATIMKQNIEQTSLCWAQVGKQTDLIKAQVSFMYSAASILLNIDI